MRLERLLSNVVTFALLALAPAVAQSQNLLVNGDLSQPPAGDVSPLGWTLDESPADTRDPATLTDFADHTTLPNDTNPDNRGLWFKPFEGNFPGFPDVLTVDADLHQTVPAVPGQEYRMSGWARFEGGYPGGVDNLDPSAPAPRGGQPSLTDTVFALEFFDALNSPLGGVSLELKAAGQLNDNLWRQHVLTAVAPLNTAFARVRASMIDGEFNADLAPGPGQSAFVDDFSLTAVPEPASWLLGLLTLCVAKLARRSRGV